MLKKISFSFVVELVLFTVFAFFTIRPVTNYDVWFHLKYGELIAITGKIPFTDLFAHTTFGHPIIPYEWLFELILFEAGRLFGTLGIQLLTASLILGYLYFFRKILTELLPIPLFARVLLYGGLYLIGFDFWVERPQSAAYLLFMVVLYLVLKYALTKKNYLALTIPLFWIWTNLHASMILGLYLFFAFAALFCFFFITTKERQNLIFARNFLIFAVINLIITVLPPLGTKVYELLIVFAQNRDFISKAIDEWVPLSKLAERYYSYLAIMLLAGLAYFFALWKKMPRVTFNQLLLLPMIPLGLFVITGVRQTPFSLPAIFILFIPFFQLTHLKTPKTLGIITTLCLSALLILGMAFYKKEEEAAIISYPKAAINFIEQEDIKGNMFNEYHLGGYLLYELGPERKTFIDGRTEMFIPEVFPEFMNFSAKTHLEDRKYLSHFNRLVKKYNVSWAILTTARFGLSWRLGRILTNDPAWRLIFFDDTARIYIRNDGLNDNLINKYGIKAATPYTSTLYRQGKSKDAYDEYSKMNKLVPSSVSENALGFLYLEKQEFLQAEAHFKKALSIKPRSAAPKMNLAELAAKDGNLDRAISLYRQAIKDEPERGLAYLRLGQLLIQKDQNNQTEAQEIWKQGLKATPDEEVLQKIRQALRSG